MKQRRFKIQYLNQIQRRNDILRTKKYAVGVIAFITLYYNAGINFFKEEHVKLVFILVSQVSFI